MLRQQVNQPRGMDRGRSPTPPRGSALDRDKSPGALPRSPRDLEGELQLVMGGWQDEIRHAFELGGFKDAIHDVWAPYVRTTFMKITLRFPDEGTSISTKRAFQTQVLQGIKALGPKSQVLGSEGRELWITKQRAPEERNKIKAVVSTKDFIERYIASMPDKKFEVPELDWRGRVYLGRINVLFHVERSEPAAEDFHHQDAKGNHTGWFLSAKAMDGRGTGTASAAATGNMGQTHGQLLTRR